MCVFECRFLHKSAVTAEAKKRGVRVPESEVTDGCELPNMFRWERNSSPLQE